MQVVGSLLHWSLGPKQTPREITEMTRKYAYHVFVVSDYVELFFWDFQWKAPWLLEDDNEHRL